MIVALILQVGCAREVPPLGGGASHRNERHMEEVGINQVGYRPDDAKSGYVGGYRGDFEVLDAAGRVVLRGTAVPRGFDPLSGDDLSTLDLSALSAPGEYHVRLTGGAGESPPFVVGPDPYRELARALLKELYFQRCGVALEPRHAGQWAHGACHRAPASLHGESGAAIDASGGWHDAGDYGRYVVPGAVTVSVLLLAYELFPQVRWDDLGIPESGNGLPDLLDEARWELDWLMKMQDPADGGVHHKVTTSSFPGFIMPEEDLMPEIVAPISPTATAAFAATLAQASRIFRESDPPLAERMVGAARRAFAWLVENPHALQFRNPADIATGEYGDPNDSDERSWASIELARATGDEGYLHDLSAAWLEQASEESGGPAWSRARAAFELGWRETGGFALLSLLGGSWRPGGAGEALTARLLPSYRAFLSDCVRRAEAGYGVAVDREDFVWGSNMLVMNRAIHLIAGPRLLADSGEGSAASLVTARRHLDYLLGANPLARSYVSGFGGRGVMHPHNRPSIADGVSEPVPGMVAGGPNPGRQDPEASAAFAEATPPMRAYLDSAGSYSTNENAIYWNSAAFFVAAAFTE